MSGVSNKKRLSISVWLEIHSTGSRWCAVVMLIALNVSISLVVYFPGKSSNTAVRIPVLVARFDEMASLYQMTRVNCSSLFSNHTESVKRAVALSKVIAAEEERLFQTGSSAQRKPDDVTAVGLTQEVKKWYGEFERLGDQWYLNATKDCEWFKRSRGYVTSSVTLEEEEFPIAYSLVVFKDIEMVERLLRSVYRPQNRYCIHVDSSKDTQFYSAVQAVAVCFRDNVRMSSRQVDVRWATFTVLEPELICMQDLWDMDDNVTERTGDAQERVAKEKRKKWKYFINLTGQ